MTQLDKLTVEEVAEVIGVRVDAFAGNCHSISLKIVKSDIFPVARVARGVAKNVTSQHSWVVVGEDCYDPDALILDPTLWTYDEQVQGLWWGTLLDGRHKPHGMGSIWQWGRPSHFGGETLSLEQPLVDALSGEAWDFLEMVGPLDRRGWMQLGTAPAEGWPAGEIWGAMYQSENLCAYTQIDRVGMTTKLNPGGVFIKD